jgi:transposase InsO family protein
VLHREGLAAYEAKCAPYIERDPDSIEPGQAWVGDHHQFNCWVRYRNTWVRPWITAWEDMRSRMIVGRTISAGPNQTTILTAMRQGIDRCGPPDSVKIDNGKDYDSEAWTGTTKVRRRATAKGCIDEQFVAGIYAMMDIAISFAQPYHPQSKPIERWFDTLDCQFTKTIPTYCGKDSDRKPEYLADMLKSDKALAEAYSMVDFTELVDRYIEVYNNTAHTGAGMEGRSPAQVMATRQSRRVLKTGVADLLMQVWSKELTIGKNGICFKGLRYGQYCHELLWNQGKKVRVSYNPDDVSRISVYDATNLQFICCAEQNQLVGYGPVGEEHLREGMRRKGQVLRVAKQYRKTQRDAFADLPTLAIRAQQEAQQAEAEETVATMRPVPTVLDGQVVIQRQVATRRAVKKAAGAENMETVPDFDLGYDIFEIRPKEKSKYDGIQLVKLWDD